MSSNGQTTERSAGGARRTQVRVRIERLRESRQRSIIGMAELIGLAGSAIMLLAVIFTYLYFYSPAESRRMTALVERDRLQKKLSDMQKEVELKGTTQDNIVHISQSLEKFENEHLTSRDEGRVTLYNTLIQLIRSNSLRNTSGPAYTYLEAKDADTQQRPRTTSNKWQSLYPGIAVVVTVEGKYADLRHFIRDIEASHQFIVINAIELENATDTNNGNGVGTIVPAIPALTPQSTTPRSMTPQAGPLQTTTPQATPPHGSSLVSLKVDMTAYFRRESGSEATEQPAANASR
jgi:hypothetical protein